MYIKCRRYLQSADTAINSSIKLYFQPKDVFDESTLCKNRSILTVNQSRIVAGNCNEMLFFKMQMLRACVSISPKLRNDCPCCSFSSDNITGIVTIVNVVICYQVIPSTADFVEMQMWKK